MPRNGNPVNEDLSPVSQEQYPSREPYFSHRFTRLLTKSCVAHEIGTVAAYLLTSIVHQEDAVRYRRAVTFYDGQLLPIVGVSDQKTLARARSKAVEAGWLHYEHGCKGKPGRYWVTIPDHAHGMDDTPVDEGEPEPVFTGKMPENVGSNSGGIVLLNGGHSGGNAGEHGVLPTLSQEPKNPIPNPEERAHAPGGKSGDSFDLPGGLQELAAAWNSLPEGIASRVAKPGSKAILAGWKRAQTDAETREALSDPDKLMAAIERQRAFLAGQGWFDFLWLFGKGRDLEWNVSKLLNGKYDDSKRSGSNGSRRGASDHKADLRFDPSEFNYGGD